MASSAVFITHRVRPGQREAVFAVWQKHMAPAIAANLGHEAYFYCFDPADPDAICAFQQYRSPEEAAAGAQASQVVVRDAVGNALADGDSVTLIKDLAVKGAGQTLKRGTVIKSIRLTGDEQEIDCRHPTIKGLVLRAEFVRKV